MQKLITITIDIANLQSQAEGPFSVQEVEAVSEVLAEGWNIESWEFVTGDAEASKAVILMLLNNGMDGMEYEESYYELDEADYADENETENEDANAESAQDSADEDEDTDKEGR